MKKVTRICKITSGCIFFIACIGCINSMIKYPEIRLSSFWILLFCMLITILCFKPSKSKNNTSPPSIELNSESDDHKIEDGVLDLSAYDIPTTMYHRIIEDYITARAATATNPKFSRTKAEEDLEYEFMVKYGAEEAKLSNVFLHLRSKAYSTSDLTERIDLLTQAVNAFEKAKSFCYSKGTGGIIYFQDTWEYCHNSQNSCFSYLDIIKESLDSALNERDIIIPTIMNTIEAQDGFLQKDIYKLLPDYDKGWIRKIIKELELDNKIYRTKKSSTYELHIVSN